jgi:hypothetical protein
MSEEPDENWMVGIVHEWHEDLADSRQDIYTVTDGTPVDSP